jgi:hypothetical protein
MTIMGQKGYKLLRLRATKSATEYMAVFGALPASPVQALINTTGSGQNRFTTLSD